MAKKQKLPIVTCADCKFARLMRYATQNPIVAHCTLKNERNVASTFFYCELHRTADSLPLQILPMEFLL